MLVSCWSAKGGPGTTVVASALSLVLAARHERGALLVDLAGDVAAVLGVTDPTGPGVLDWLAAGERATPDALGRLEVEVAPGVGLIPPGASRASGSGGTAHPAGPEAAALVARLLDADGRPVVVDCGTLLGPEGPVGGVRATLAASSATSLLVTRPCYVALRHALRCPVPPTGVVVVREPGRALGPAEVEDVLGVAVVSCVDVDPGIARAVDAGLLASRLPRSLRRQLEPAL